MFEGSESKEKKKSKKPIRHFFRLLYRISIREDIFDIKKALLCTYFGLVKEMAIVRFLFYCLYTEMSTHTGGATVQCKTESRPEIVAFPDFIASEYKTDVYLKSFRLRLRYLA